MKSAERWESVGDAQAVRIPCRALGWADSVHGFLGFGIARAEGAADQAAVVPLPVHQKWEGALHAHFVRVSHKDGGDDRVNEAIENFRAELALDERRERFFLGGWSRRAESFGENAPLGAGADKTCGEQSLRRKRSTMERTVTDNVALGFGVATQKFGLKIQVAHEAPRGGGETRKLRAGFVEEILLANGGDHAAGAIASF
ncbi:MAG: hypothetical protein ABSG69_14255 [Candidatus Acidiferrum sp.]|jgi:hypothetical protein